MTRIEAFQKLQSAFMRAVKESGEVEAVIAELEAIGIRVGDVGIDIEISFQEAAVGAQQSFDEDFLRLLRINPDVKVQE